LGWKAIVKPKNWGSLPGKTQRKNSAGMRLRIEQAVRMIPRGKVSTYGGVARAAGFPGAARQVAAALRRGFGLPWQRVLGAGGEIRLTGDSAIEQRLRLEAEGVGFRGRRVNMKAHEWKFGRLPKAPPGPRATRGKNESLPG
jgi:methylated-DNA-protein-cysteine methyltransferase-like protein